MRILLAILISISPILGLAQVRTNNKVSAYNRAEGAAIYENYSINQSFDSDLNGVTTLGGTPTIETTSGVRLIGAGSLKWATATNTDVMTIRSKAVPIGLNGQNCQSKFLYATPSGGSVSTQEFTVYAKNSAGTQISATTNLPATFDIANPQQARTVIVFYPCPYNSGTPANSYVDLQFNHTASNSTAFLVDELFTQYAVDVGDGVPNGVFSAKIDASGNVTDENQDWISGNASVSTGVFTITLNSGLFTIAPNCVTSLAGSSQRISKVTSATTTTVVVNTYNLTPTSVSQEFNITCTKAGTDFIQQTITPNQWNYDWTAASLSTTQQGFGTVTYTNAMDCRHKRAGSDLLFDCKFTAGTVAASEARLTLPNGLTIDSTKTPAIKVAEGYWVSNASSATTVKRGTVLINGGNTYVTFSLDDYTTASSPLTSQNGNTIISTGAIVSLYARIPISGWTENQNAPQLLAIVTASDGNQVLKVAGAVISAATSPATTVSN